MKLKLLCGAAVLAGMIGSSALAASVNVYDNTTSDLHTRLQTGTAEVGDEIILSGGWGSYKLTDFTFQYFGSTLGPNVQMEVRFYKNDGAAYGTSHLPGTKIWDSGVFSVLDTSRSTLTFDASNDDAFAAGLFVPDRFTWTVQLFNVATGGVGGVDLYSPPTTGFNFTDYWYKTANGWELRTLEGVDVAFAAKLDAVPEPTTLSLLAGFGLLMLAIRRSR